MCLSHEEGFCHGVQNTILETSHQLPILAEKLFTHTVVFCFFPGGLSVFSSCWHPDSTAQHLCLHTATSSAAFWSWQPRHKPEVPEMWGGLGTLQGNKHSGMCRTAGHAHPLSALTHSASDTPASLGAVSQTGSVKMIFQRLSQFLMNKSLFIYCVNDQFTKFWSDAKLFTTYIVMFVFLYFFLKYRNWEPKVGKAKCYKY